MLNQAYAAVQQIQSQISNIHSISQLKKIFKNKQVGLSIKISSPTVWILDWDLSNNTIAGTLELRLEPILSINSEIIKLHERSFLFQDPKPNSLFSIESRLIEFVRKSVNNID